MNVSESVVRDASSRYQVITKLGQGGMARVMLVLSRGRGGVNKLLVLKELLPGLKEDPDFLLMFLDEARLTVRLNHPNVVQTYEVNSEGEQPYLVMEYLEGQSLSTLVKEVGREAFPIDLHIFVLAEVAAGLHHAHELCDFDGSPLGVVHRDVSPQNVFVTYDGQVKVLDFGIAKATDSDSKTHTGVFKGKLGYAAPEQIGALSLDRRSDVFSLGVMLWEALAQQRLASNEAEVSLMQRRISGADPKILSVAPETPLELARVCDRAMALDPEKRFATALEFRSALLSYLETSKRVGAHELGELMRKTFADARAQIRQQIEARVKELSSIPASAVVSADTPSQPDRLQTPSNGTAFRTALTSNPSADEESSATKSPTSTARRWATGIGLAVLGVGVIALFPIVRKARQDRQWVMASSSAGESSAPIADASAPTSNVEVSIVVEPQGAQLYIDDVLVANNPFHAGLPKSTAGRRIRAAAAGFVTQERIVVFDHDVDLKVELKPELKPDPKSTAASPPEKETSRPKHNGRASTPKESPTSTSTTATAAAAATNPPAADAPTGTSRKKPRTIDDTF